MSGCKTLTANASDNVAAALRAVDCLANETAASAFGRLFSSGGVLLPALTGVLTLYIIFFAISLLTGRSRIGISALTPRMMTLGLVLTFTTSWVAYQSVVWSLAVGAPDQIASVLMGTRGSATQIFADRVDLIFRAIAEVGDSTSGQAGATPAVSGSFTPANLMWLGALLLLLGTVGVLVTARIALAVLLALGPIFILFGLFSGTRGLCAGWLRGMVMTAVTPLFVVLGGGLILELLVPVINGLRGDTGVDGRAALALFLIAAVHVALMTMVLKVSATIVSGWTVFGLGAEKGDIDRSSSTITVAPSAAMPAQTDMAQAATTADSGSRRATAIARAVSLTADAQSIPQPANTNQPNGAIGRSIQIATAVDGQSRATRPRSRELGQQFRMGKPKLVENIR